MFGCSLYEIFPARAPAANSTALFDIQKQLSIEAGVGRSALLQAGFQAAALCCTLLVAIGSGLITGELRNIAIDTVPQNKTISRS